MMLRIIGAVLVVASCAGFGFLLALNYKAEERALRQLLEALNIMESQLRYSMLPLPELALSAAAAGGVIERILLCFVAEVETNTHADPSACMIAALEGQRLPEITKSLLVTLGRSLGTFDLEGQIKALKAVQGDCKQQINLLSQNRDVRIRNYQTLSICAGAALAILLI